MQLLRLLHTLKKAEKVQLLYLLKHGAHFNGLRSIIAFLNRSYFCPDCCKGYNTENAAHHSCMGRNCSSCQRTRFQKDKGGCPDFTPGKKRTIPRKDCQRDFYGPDCYKDHKTKKGKKKVSLCHKLKKCLHCCKGYTVNPTQPHKCYHDTCRHRHEFVEIYKKMKMKAQKMWTMMMRMRRRRRRRTFHLSWCLAT